MQLLFLIEELLDAIERQKTDGEVPSTGESGPVQMPSDLLNDETEKPSRWLASLFGYYSGRTPAGKVPFAGWTGRQRPNSAVFWSC